MSPLPEAPRRVPEGGKLMAYYMVEYTGEIHRFTNKDDLIQALIEWLPIERASVVDSVREGKEWLAQYGE